MYYINVNAIYVKSHKIMFGLSAEYSTVFTRTSAVIVQRALWVTLCLKKIPLFFQV